MKIPVLLLHDYFAELPRELIYELKIEVPQSCHITTRGVSDFNRESIELRMNTGVIKLFRKYLPEQTGICFFSLDTEIPVISLLTESNQEVFSTRKK